LDDSEDSDDDLEEGEERVHDKSTPPGSSDKFYARNASNGVENEAGNRDVSPNMSLSLEKPMEDLIKVESSLYDELSVFAETIDLWDKDPAYIANKASAKVVSKFFASSNSNNALPEVLQFQNFLLNNGGRTGGWTDFNHQTFLKIRRRYLPRNLKKICSVPDNLRDQFLQEVTSALYLNSIERAHDHDVWFVTLNKLELLSKNAMKKFKTCHKITPSVEETGTQIRPKLTSERSLDRSQKRDQIIAWREAKQRELDQKLEEERRRMEEQQRIEELKRQKRVKELKSRMEEYRLRRESLGEVKAGSHQIHERIMNSSKKTLTELDKKRINERNSHLIQLQIRRKLAKSRKQQESQDRINRANSKFRVEVKRDPDRAMGHTELWKLRMQDLKEEKVQASRLQPTAMRILSDRPQRAVPEWRRQITAT
uniref:Coiled-coil domain-containing protein 113 n=1 Tax=Rodentolepis nana TaxID=102285 RepID=A0A0R3TPH7_RODNA